MTEKSNVVSLANQRQSLDPTARPFLVMLTAGPSIRDALRAVLPRLSRDQQRAMMAVVAFRLMGGQLPANMTLLTHLPTMAGMHDQTIAAAFQMLVEAGILGYDEKAATFFWPELERLFAMAEKVADAPRDAPPDAPVAP